MWWCGNGWPARVGQKLANPWGLYDMHGNVTEWCQDLFDWEHPEYSGRVIRGGAYWDDWSAWGVYARVCRSAYRDSFGPDYWPYNLGFRVVLAPGQ